MVVVALRSVITVMAEEAVMAGAARVGMGMVMVRIKRVHSTQLLLAGSTAITAAAASGSSGGGIPRGHALDEA